VKGERKEACDASLMVERKRFSTGAGINSLSLEAIASRAVEFVSLRIKSRVDKLCMDNGASSLIASFTFSSHFVLSFR
jgi:hypothetical protein